MLISFLIPIAEIAKSAKTDLSFPTATGFRSHVTASRPRQHRAPPTQTLSCQTLRLADPGLPPFFVSGGFMSTLIDRIDSRSANGRITTGGSTPAERLRTTMAACRVQFTWFGTKKSLTADQKAQAAEPFDAEGKFLSAGKKLLDTNHKAFRAVTAIRTKITDSWRGLTLPFPEPGVRLIKHDQVEDFDRQMADYKAELEDAVRTLDDYFDELRQSAARRLGSLYNPADYPATLVGLFGVSWDYPNIEPPDYLIGLSPDLYRQEQERVKARFEEAVQLAEQAFLDEFARVVAHLTERITGANEDGTPRSSGTRPSTTCATSSSDFAR